MLPREPSRSVLLQHLWMKSSARNLNWLRSVWNPCGVFANLPRNNLTARWSAGILMDISKGTAGTHLNPGTTDLSPVPSDIRSFESNEQWKAGLRKSIEGSLLATVNNAKRNYEERLRKPCRVFDGLHRWRWAFILFSFGERWCPMHIVEK